MLHAQASSSVLTVSPPDTFSPRREFMREDHVSSSFALLAIAGAGFVRLSSFSRELVAALRCTFQLREVLRGIREESSLNLVEFNLLGKPWTQTKNIESEKIFVEILAVILQHGYVFLSTIDYGRERDDRVSIAFSKPISAQLSTPTRVPFALSFPSSTVLRVINPPLSFSPAIIQAARSAWPRGVISEGTVSEKCYEFRLKGYRWFQEDNFSADSLHQIFHLLYELDLHAFSLLTSITLSGNHSRAKDLWIFSGPPCETSSDSVTNGLNVDLPYSLSPSGLKSAPHPILTSSPGGSNNFDDTLHVGSSSLPGSLPGSSSTLAHARSATEPYPSHHRTPPISTSVLRKKNFRPVGTIPSPLGRSSSEEFSMRGHNVVTNERVDMTGIGSGGQRNLSAARVAGTTRPLSPQPLPRASTEHEPVTHQNQQDVGGRIKTGDAFYETGFDNNYSMHSSAGGLHDEFQSADYPVHPSSLGSSSESRDFSWQLTPRDSTELSTYAPQSVNGYPELGSRIDSTLPILNSAVFRDSAFSSATRHSYEVPITWTGLPELDKGKEREFLSSPRPPGEHEEGGYSEGGPEKLSRPSQRISTAPRFPSTGDWQPTPIDEIPEDSDLGVASFGDPRRRAARDRSPERREVDAERVTSPVLMSSDKPGAARKSEVAQYDVIARRSLPPPTPTRTDGWVLVNVAESTLDSGNIRISGATGTLPGKTPLRSSLSPVAKAIAAEDATSSTSQCRPQGTSGFRRFLPGSKVKYRSAATDASTASVRVSEQEKKARVPSLKERWRKKTTLDT